MCILGDILLGGYYGDVGNSYNDDGKMCIKSV